MQRIIDITDHVKVPDSTTNVRTDSTSSLLEALTDSTRLSRSSIPSIQPSIVVGETVTEVVDSPAPRSSRIARSMREIAELVSLLEDRERKGLATKQVLSLIASTDSRQPTTMSSSTTTERRSGLADSRISSHLSSQTVGELHLA